LSQQQQSKAQWADRQRRRWVVGVVAVLAIVGAVYVVVRGNSPTAGGPVARAVPVVSITVPHAAPVARTVSITGTIAARHDLPIGPEGESGRIAAVLVEIGDRVKRGQVLARLDTSTLRPEVQRLMAALDQSKAEAELAQAEYQRAIGVGAAGALSKEEVGRRGSAAVTAAAKVKVAAAQLEEGRARLARSEIHAPAAGVVLSRTAEVGQIAGPGSGALFRLAEAGEVELRGAVSEQDLPNLSVGQPATVRLTGIDSPFGGSVRLIGAIIDANSRLGEVRIALKSDPNLRPGSFARAEVAVGNERRPVVPQTAILSDALGLHVLIVGRDDHVLRRAVRVSGTTPDGVVISEGLTGEERVVTTAGAFLREGEPVIVAEASATPASPTGAKP
jgi:RND family efflux transporter MFP subunit